MAGTLTKNKHFFSSSNEIRWLNGLGRRGWRLWAINGRKYAFTSEEGKTFRYSMEWQDCAIDSPAARERVMEKASLGEPVCAQRSLWLYFVSEHPVSMTKQALKKNRAHYRNPFLFFFILAAVCAALIVYHIHSIPFLEEQGLTITDPFFRGNENPFLDLLLRLVYGLWLVVYNFFLLFGHFLGNTLATAVVSVLTPLFLTSLTVSLVWGIEWIRWLAVKPSPESGASEEDRERAPSGPEETASGESGEILRGETETFFRLYDGEDETLPPEEDAEQPSPDEEPPGEETAPETEEENEKDKERTEEEEADAEI